MIDQSLIDAIRSWPDEDRSPTEQCVLHLANEIDRLRNGLEFLILHGDWESPSGIDFTDAVTQLLDPKE